MRTSLPRPFGDRIGHRFDMAVGRVVENQNLGHDLLLDALNVARPSWLRCVHQDDLGVFQRRDLQDILVLHRGAVAGVQPHAVDLHRAEAGTR